MSHWAYYNEIDPFAAEWLRNLIKQKLIAPGVVDERSIEDVTPAELKDFIQCHFFAGIGVWSYALRQSGWRDDQPVWTGSCPCQPFSSAGKGAGFIDERHLWPAWFHLIEQCKPSVIFGEQVASKDGLAWLDLVQSDLEAENYTNAAVDLCAAGVGAPHIRQRLWFVAEKIMDNAKCKRLERYSWNESEKKRWQKPMRSVVTPSLSNSFSYAECEQLARSLYRCGENKSKSESGEATKLTGYGPTNGFWRDSEWIYCRDNKIRPIESSIEPLVDGASNRVGRIRAYGNAINAEVAKEFIKAYLEIKKG